MNVFQLSVAAVLSVALASPSFAQPAAPGRVAPPADVRLPARGGKIRQGVRCATDEANKGLARRPPSAGGAAALQGSEAVGGVRDIPVAFHVIYSVKRGRELGNVSLARIEDQIEVLNDAYAGRGFSFHLAGVTRTQNNQWFTGCYNSSTEADFKQALAVDPATTLNLYSCQLAQNILGYAYYPDTFDEDHFLHGAVLHHESLPGGGWGNYSLGDTCTHEVGHYLGLAHTFENGCSSPGDEVADTPAEASPAYDCDPSRDTCASPGLDPIYNFMDYTDDACMFEFTPGQEVRMDEQVSAYRPSLGSPPPGCGDGNCDAGEACTCTADCGSAPATESSCTGGADEDCDGKVDCADTDCSGSPSCPSCGATGSSCTADSQCCFGKCKGKPGSRTCN
ncbi:MAG: zinc metalloprotease [Candidatus Binatia bacterium]